MGQGAGLDGCGKSHHHRDSIPGPPARSVSLYRLIYPGPKFKSIKGNALPVHAMKTESGGIAPSILDLGTGCEWLCSRTRRIDPGYPN